MFKFISNRGDTIEFKDTYKLTNAEGLSELDVNIQTEKAPFQDGETLLNQLFGARDITLELVIRAKNLAEIEQFRRNISKTFNPKQGTGVLRYEQNNNTYEIEVVPQSPPTFPGGAGRSNGHQRTIINLQANNPFWRDDNKTIVTLAQYVGGLSFPFTFDIEFGTSADSQITENTGDIETPLFITINGPATNPTVTNVTTGQKLEIQQTITDTQKIEINTAFGEKQITLIDGGTETNVLHWLTNDSEFFNLQLGNNELAFEEDSDSADAGNLDIEYYQRYVGV